MGGAWAPFFHDASELVGMEEFFLKLHSAPVVMEAIIERCFQFYYEVTERMFVQNPGKIDIFFMGNDFGMQRSLMFSPKMFRDYFKPRLKKLIELGHRHGLYVALHSCGSVRAIIPDLIEIGLDCLNPIQVSATGMNPVELKREFGKDLMFFGGIDFNETIMRGSERQVREETKRIIEIMGSDGRYIVAPSHDHCIRGTPPENIIALFDEAKRFFQ
jgi:uroporphyrinogen decarboxylase